MLVTSLALEDLVDESFRSDVFERWSRAEVCLDSVVDKSHQPGSDYNTTSFVSKMNNGNGNLSHGCVLPVCRYSLGRIC